MRTSEQRVRVPCLPDLGTHSGGWADWHPQVWFLAGVAAVYSGTRTHSPGGRDARRSVGQGNPSSHSHFPSSQPYPPEPNQDPVGLGPGPLLIGSQEVPHHGNAPARATGGGPGVRLMLCRAACLPPAPGPPLTAPQGSAPRLAGSWGSTRSWPGPASVSPGCLPGQAIPQQVPGMILVPMPYPDLGAICAENGQPGVLPCSHPPKPSVQRLTSAHNACVCKVFGKDGSQTGQGLLVACRVG